MNLFIQNKRNTRAEENDPFSDSSPYGYERIVFKCTELYHNIYIHVSIASSLRSM